MSYQDSATTTNWSAAAALRWHLHRDTGLAQYFWLLGPLLGMSWSCLISSEKRQQDGFVNMLLVVLAALLD